ncbi:MAG TPA: DUF58 domain-containing protein [Spirochaetota bacterium]|nr:DUF58 domain-containing protein [Spirochaetota bacterium]HPF04534.1 DUF58 domain-containing protein [Spirochaetota bacterium]HPR38033.1 DUF58 domain-containing protein [Spirochaetota bacterium]HRX46059.1 DUF58 domain-containing protein [Spirochaetota bacterium]
MDSKEVALLRKIRVETGKKINTMFSGEYRSAFKGYGLSFDSVREYIPGDDVRSIDWNVSARMNHLYIKEYIEERELSIVLIVDVSASTLFGSGRSKRDVVLEFVTFMLHLAQMNNDRISVILFSDRIEKYLKPRKGRKFVLKVLDEILMIRPSGKGTDLPAALDFFQQVTRKRGIVFVVSDFLSGSHDEVMLKMKILARRHDIIPVQVSDPMEKNMKVSGLAEFIDLETGENFLSDSIYENSRLPDTAGFETIKLSTDEQIEVPLLKFFTKRNRAALRR